MLLITAIFPLFILQTTAFFRGINFGATLPNGACRSQADWLRAFKAVKSSAAQFDNVRVFASSDCNTLANAVPAAIEADVKILGGIWTQNEDHYRAEKAALLDALNRWPKWTRWLMAVSVGSEDLYRKEVPGSQITAKIKEVRSLLRAIGVTVPIGHVDTFTAWVDPDNKSVIQAVDFVGVDEYPYWQGATMQQAPEVFWSTFEEVLNATLAVKPGVPIWITETGWPITGKSFGAATASIDNAKTFWNTVACDAFKRTNFFWYAYAEPTSDPSFSTFDGNDLPVFDLSCTAGTEEVD